MNNLKVKKGDQVVVLTGKDKGKTGEILACDPKSNRIIVKDVNVQKKHVKAKSAQEAGGIIDMEGPINASNVMVLEGSTPVRVGYKTEGGKKVRISKKSGQAIK